jgi:gliding motility-associated-like protein
VGVPDSPVIAGVAHTDATCGVDNGTITITATGVSGVTLEYMIDGYPWQTSNVFSNLPPGSYNVYIRYLSFNQCQVAFTGNPVVIGDLASPSITLVDHTDASCGNNNGSITITASGGTAPLQYSIDNGGTWQSSNVFLNLAPGNYTVRITDANSCEVTYTGNPVIIAMIPAPVAPTSATVDRNNLCSDDAGDIVLTATGGSGLTLEWFTGSCGGTPVGSGNNLTIPSPVVTTTYFVYWTSAICGNSSCASVTVTVVDPPSTSDAGPDQSLCGVLTATLAGNQPAVGNGLWTQTVGPGSSVFADPALFNTQVTVTQYGAYTFRWTISTGTACPPSLDEVTHTFSDVVVVTVGSNSPVCTGETIYLTSSISGATYAWTGPNGFTSALQNPEIPNAVLASEGTYNVTVSNIPGGCPSTSGNTVVDIIEAPTPPTLATADPAEICQGFTGTIQLTATGGNGTEIVWYTESCGGTQIGTGNVIIIPAPSVTTTYFTAWTTLECGSSNCASVTVTVADPPTTADAGQDQSLCGVLTATLQGNDPAIGTGTWTTVSGPGTVTFSNPSTYNSQVTVSVEGIYELQWTISNGTVCAPSSDQVSLNFGDAIQVVAGSNSPVCSGQNINLTSSISGASYSWTGPNGFTSNLQNPVILNAAATNEGTYTVSVTGIPGGCPPTSNSTDVEVNLSPVEPSSVSADITSFCAGSAGNITLTANGGAGDAVEWFTGGCGGTLIGMGVTLVIPAPAVTTTYDARWSSVTCGESACRSVTVTVEQPPTQANAGTNQSICNNLYTTLEANSPVVGSGQWSTISGPGTILYSDASLPNTLINASNMGTYVLRWTITSGAICPSSADEVSVEFGNQIIVSASSNSPVCEGDDITLFSSISGATYNWTGPGGYTSSLQNPVIANATTVNNGDYTITVSDIPGGCPTTSATIAVVVSSIPAAPAVNSQNIAGSAQEVCEGSTVNYSIAIPTSGSTYTWSISGGGTIIPGASSDIINVLWASAGGSHDLAVKETNSTGCEGPPFTLAVTILPALHPAVSIQADHNPVCSGDPVRFTASVTDGGINPVYVWKRNGVIAGNNSPDFILDIPAGNDLVTCEVTPAGLCADPAVAVSNALTLTVLAPLTISCSTEDPVCSGTPTLLTPGSGFASYLWSDGSTGPSVTVQDPGVYWVMVTDSYGCTASDTVSVEPCGTVMINVPNAFTPDSDGKNDRLMVSCSNPDLISNFELLIYNKWGQLIFRGKEISEGWDGTQDGKTCPIDVYAYILSYTVTEPKTTNRQLAGNVALIR